MKYTPAKTGSILRSFATHHNHGDGWRYTRNRGDLEYIRFRRDHTGYDHWTKRWSRALNVKAMLGIDSFSKSLGLRREFRTNVKREGLLKALQRVWYQALAHVIVNGRKDKNLPDGSINGNYVFWEEDGEYIECVGPTVGEKIADFLEQEPNHPHAVAIAAEINRIWALPRKPEGDNA